MTITPMARRDAVRGMGALTLAATLATPSAKSATAVGQGTGRVSVPGGDLAYRIVGEGRGVPLLMVHGGPGGNHLYMRPLASLGSDRPVIFYDQLDCGESDHPDNPANWTVERFVSEIDPIRDALGLSELHILGSSYGGLFAVEYAARQPKGLRGCVLAGPVINTPRSYEDQTTLVKLLPDEAAKAILENEASGTINNNDAYNKAVDVFLHRHMCRIDPWPDDIKASFEKYNWNVNNAMIGPYWTKSGGTYGSHDATSKLNKIMVPTLFTSGEFDLISSGSMAEYQHEVPGSMRHMIKDGSHLPWFESPNEYNRIIANFLRRIG